MKLSELSTDLALDVLCELTPHVSNIMEDEQIISALSGILPKQQNGEQVEEQDGLAFCFSMIGGLTKMAPVLLKTHRADVYNILSVMNEKTVEEISTQHITDTIRQLREVLQDNELLSFFKSFARRAQNEQSAPSAASPA